MMYMNPWMWGMYWNPIFIAFFLVSMVITMAAQGFLMSTYNRFKRQRASTGQSGAVVARAMLDRNGLFDVRVEQSKGKLTDHYDPKQRVVRLSEHNYHEASIAAVAVAAHEVGHAIQHAEGYFPLTFRTAFVPIANLGSRLGYIIIIAGVFLGAFGLAEIGLVLMSSILVFQLITLPVEFNASRRAMQQMTDMNMLYSKQEQRGARKVLNAAAMTYVAALVVSLLEVARWAMIIAGSRGRRQ